MRSISFPRLDRSRMCCAILLGAVDASVTAGYIFGVDPIVWHVATLIAKFCFLMFTLGRWQPVRFPAILFLVGFASLVAISSAQSERHGGRLRPGRGLSGAPLDDQHAAESRETESLHPRRGGGDHRRRRRPRPALPHRAHPTSEWGRSSSISVATSPTSAARSPGAPPGRRGLRHAAPAGPGRHRGAAGRHPVAAGPIVVAVLHLGDHRAGGVQSRATVELAADGVPGGGCRGRGDPRLPDPAWRQDHPVGERHLRAQQRIPGSRKRLFRAGRAVGLRLAQLQRQPDLRLRPEPITMSSATWAHTTCSCPPCRSLASWL